MTKENKIERLEFHISYACANDCIFCSEYDQLMRLKGEFVPLADIEKELAKLDKHPLSHVTLTGGEPTLHPELKGILGFFKDKGFKTYLTTNNGRITDAAFADEVLPLLDEVCFSVHGYNDASHDALTNTKGSFLKMTRALANAKKHSPRLKVFANVVAVNGNFEHIPKIISFLNEWEMFSHIMISNVAPEGKGRYDLACLAVALGKWRQAMGGMAEAAREGESELRFFGLPLCVLGEYAESSNDLWFSPRVTVEKWKDENSVFYKHTESFDPRRKRVQPDVCSSCFRRGDCGGVFEDYYELYGQDELEAITN